jgi:hypothetical protein
MSEALRGDVGSVFNISGKKREQKRREMKMYGLENTVQGLMLSVLIKCVLCSGVQHVVEFRFTLFPKTRAPQRLHIIVHLMLFASNLCVRLFLLVNDVVEK